jgi:hypothetical protein
VEFGDLKTVRLLGGNIQECVEEQLYTFTGFSANRAHEAEIELDLPLNSSNRALPAYIRAELYSQRTGKVMKCLTNPIWIERQAK